MSSTGRHRQAQQQARRPGVIDGGAFLLLRLPWWPDLIEDLRELGRWDADERAWRISWADAAELGDVLAEYGLALHRQVLEQQQSVAEELRRELKRLRATLGSSRSQPPADPFRALFAALPAHLRKPAYRALARALHPDVGGDHEAMKALNAAFSQGGFE